MTPWHRCTLAPLAVVGAVLSFGGCTDETSASDPVPVPCGPSDVPLGDDGCRPPGIASDGCAPGFEWDGRDACEPLLPAASCPSGTMAVPGDGACRDIAPCGSAPWGDGPFGPDTVYVDASYGGTDGDGSAERPFTSLLTAVDVAPAGATIAIAAGSYVGDVNVHRSVQLQGRCASLVEIVGTGALSAVAIFGGAHGTQLRDVAIRGPANGVQMSGSEGVLLERVWIHDVGGLGLGVDDHYGLGEVSLRGSLIEGAVEAAVLIQGATLRLEESVIRGTEAGQGQAFGVLLQEGRTGGAPSQAWVRSSVLEDNRSVSLAVNGAAAAVEASVIRTTRALPGVDGVAVLVQDEPSSSYSSTLDLVSSLLTGNDRAGVFVYGTTARIERTVVRDTVPVAASSSGRGLAVQSEPLRGARGSVTLVDTVLERNAEVGLFLSGASLVGSSLVVRETQAASSGRDGVGIGVQGADGDTADLTLDHALIEGNHEAGILVIDSSAVVDHVEIRDTRAAVMDQTFGDGIVAVREQSGATVTLTASVIRDSARAAIANFAASITVGSMQLECNPIDLDGERFQQADYSFDDLGNNVCGCGGTPSDCQVISSDLVPPDPLE